MKNPIRQSLSVIAPLILVIAIILSQLASTLHLQEHDQLTPQDNSCAVCVLAQINEDGLAPTVLTLFTASLLIAYVLYAYHASPFLPLHNRLAQTRAPPFFI